MFAKEIGTVLQNVTARAAISNSGVYQRSHKHRIGIYVLLYEE